MPITNSASGIGPGAITYFPVATAPAGWLKCNGAAVSRTAYAALFAVIGTTYGVGDGASTFNLPDLRGEFLRVLDEGRGVDAGRVVGSAQGGDVQSHTHTVQTADLAGAYGVGGRPVGNTPGNSNATNANSINSTGGAETRPRNIAMLACIKY